jgi:hypothetical protein
MNETVRKSFFPGFRGKTTAGKLGVAVLYLVAIVILGSAITGVIQGLIESGSGFVDLAQSLVALGWALLGFAGRLVQANPISSVLIAVPVVGGVMYVWKRKRRK